MKQKIFSLITLFLLFSSYAVAQNGKITVSGTVSDKAGMALIGVAVIERGVPTNGIITDEAGHYSITVSPEAILEISCIGYKSAVEHVNGRAVLDVVLEDDNELLEATVVIGYGTSKKGDLTGTVTVVEMDEIKTAPVTSVAHALQGKIAGAEFSSGSGEVGEESETAEKESQNITL